MTIAKNKALVDDAQALLNYNLGLCVDLKEKDEKLKDTECSRMKAEGARKEAMELVENNDKKLEESCASLLTCMHKEKVALDTIFAKVA